MPKKGKAMSAITYKKRYFGCKVAGTSLSQYKNKAGYKIKSTRHADIKKIVFKGDTVRYAQGSVVYYSKTKRDARKCNPGQSWEHGRKHCPK